MNFFFEKIQSIFDTKNDSESTILALFDEPALVVGFFLNKIPFRMLILGQKSYILDPTIFKIPQPNWYYSLNTLTLRVMIKYFVWIWMHLATNMSTSFVVYVIPTFLGKVRNQIVVTKKEIIKSLLWVVVSFFLNGLENSLV